MKNGTKAAPVKTTKKKIAKPMTDLEVIADALDDARLGIVCDSIVADALKAFERVEAQFAQQKDYIRILSRDHAARWKATTLEEVRSVAIGAVGNLVQKMQETGRGKAEWQAVLDLMLAAIGAAPSQVST